MANTYSTEAALLQLTPRTMPNGSYAGGRVRRYRNTVTMAAQAAADTITCQPVPAGHVFAFGVLTASASLGGTATLAIGISGTAAKFRAAAIFTAVDTPTLFGTSAAMSADFNTSTEVPLLTIAAASLPGAGFFIVDFYYSGQ